MNYQIKSVQVDGFVDANGVYVNQQGAWLGEIDGDIVQLYSDEDGDFVPAPANWRGLIVEEF